MSVIQWSELSRKRLVEKCRVGSCMFISNEIVICVFLTSLARDLLKPSQLYELAMTYHEKYLLYHESLNRKLKYNISPVNNRTMHLSNIISPPRRLSQQLNLLPGLKSWHPNERTPSTPKRVPESTTPTTTRLPLDCKIQFIVP